MGDPGTGQNEVINENEMTGEMEVYLVQNINRARGSYPEHVK